MFPSAPSFADMDKAKSTLRFCALLILCSALESVWGDRLDFLFRTPLNPHRIEMLWNYNRPVMIMGAAFLVVVFLTVISFFRMLASWGKKGNRRVKQSSLKAPEEKLRYSDKRRQKPEEDEALHCEHLTGKQKYLEQIDGYLKTGLIDRNEYRVLKERYQALDIADDYH